MKIVVTGKMGVGKSTILKSSDLDNVYYSDNFVKDILYVENHDVYNTLMRWYPTLTRSKKIDTKELGSILFNNKNELEKVSNLVAKYVKKWIVSLPDFSIVEMATYIKYEEFYKQYFDKVILIERDYEDLSKASYINNMKQPIEDKSIKVDKIIKNININESSNELIKYIENVRRK